MAATVEWLHCEIELVANCLTDCCWWVVVVIKFTRLVKPPVHPCVQPSSVCVYLTCVRSCFMAGLGVCVLLTLLLSLSLSFSFLSLFLLLLLLFACQRCDIAASTDEWEITVNVPVAIAVTRRLANAKSSRILTVHCICGVVSIHCHEFDNCVVEVNHHGAGKPRAQRVGWWRKGRE